MSRMPASRASWSPTRSDDWTASLFDTGFGFGDPELDAIGLDEWAGRPGREGRTSARLPEAYGASVTKLRASPPPSCSPTIAGVGRATGREATPARLVSAVLGGELAVP